jgi:glycerophosphoryl diester phosphodiesterase
LNLAAAPATLATMIGEVIAAAAAELRRAFRPLISTDLFYQLAAFALLTPIVSFGIRSLVSLSGSAVLADQEILRFALRPIGIVTLIAAAAGRIAVLALGQACLMGIAFGAVRGARTPALSALSWGAARAAGILAVTTRLVVRVLVLCAPFLALAGLVYFLLLTDFDINYYLREKPPAFWAAAAVIGALLLVMAALLLRSVSSWVYALPLLLFESVEPSRALRESERRTSGHRPGIAFVLLAWVLAVTLVSALGLSGARALAVAILPRFRESLGLLVPALGIAVLLGILVGALATALASSLFATLVVALYEKLGGGSRGALESARDVDRRYLLQGRRLLVGVLAAAAVSVVVGFILLGRLSERRPVAVIGHRGAAALAPENSLSAVERAIEDGADWVEIDVQETADGEVAVLHDSDFMKVAGSPLKIWEASFAEVRMLDIGSSFGPEFVGEPVPTLEEVLMRAKGRAKVVIELKYYGHDQQLEERVADIVDRHEMADEISVMSLERAGIEKMAALRPAYRTGLLAATAVGRLTEVDVDFLAVSVPLATPAFVRRAHARGQDVYVWTVNDELTMAQTILRGVDGLITDRPAMARAVIQRESGLTSMERLLLGAAFWLGVEPEEFRVSRDSQ